MMPKFKVILVAVLASLGCAVQAEGLIRVPLGGEPGLVENGMVVNDSGSTVQYTAPTANPPAAVSGEYLRGTLSRTGFSTLTVVFKPTVGPCEQNEGMPLLNWDDPSITGAITTAYQGNEWFPTDEWVYNPITTETVWDTVIHYFRPSPGAAMGSLENYEANVDFCVPGTQAELDAARDATEGVEYYWQVNMTRSTESSNPDATVTKDIRVRYLTLNLPTAATSSITIVSPFVEYQNLDMGLSRSIAYIMNTAVQPNIDYYINTGSVPMVFKPSSGMVDTTQQSYASY